MNSHDDSLRSRMDISQYVLYSGGYTGQDFVYSREYIWQDTVCIEEYKGHDIVYSGEYSEDDIYDIPIDDPDNIMKEMVYERSTVPELTTLDISLTKNFSDCLSPVIPTNSNGRETIC